MDRLAKHDSVQGLVGLKVWIEGYFAEPVEIVDATLEGGVTRLRVKRNDGSLEEISLLKEEVQSLIKQVDQTTTATADGLKVRTLLRSEQIRLAWAYDEFFGVSVSGVIPLPHQLEAVYGRMLRQPRLRFLLADDPGAGKTIMAGLLFKELKLRGVVERVLVIVPAPLTIQWQDEMLRFFNEFFIIINAENDRRQLVDLWRRESQVITSLDYAKQPNVRERVWAADWDLVIVDEAHKCSAYTQSVARGQPRIRKTKRYQLIEELSKRPTLMLLFLTATPHHGDEDRFSHFLRLLDPDVLPDRRFFHDSEDEERRIRISMLQVRDNPWFLRRLKEDLRDFDGRPLFPKRHSITVKFELTRDEYELYRRVSDYLNQYLVGGTGARRHSIALTRTVLQRRLASSTFAIYRSLERRLQRQRELLEQLESLPEDERRRKLARLLGLIDEEVEEGDLDDADKEMLIDTVTTAEHMEQLREEVAELENLVAFAEGIYKKASSDSKLNRLREVLQQSRFAELRDGRGKLLIFTEHRDTMQHLAEHLERWGYSVCTIHGGMDPRARKEAQEKFRTSAQICVATEAAGEGINLQFCHLMINYDIPWNPTRLEQRMGRIHRIGQRRDVYVYNFVAERSVDGHPIIEGRILARLLEKLERMREALGSDRVYDIIGQVLDLNEVNLTEMLRQAALYPARLEDYEGRIQKLTEKRLKEYERQTGIALARAYVDLTVVQRKRYEAEERRLMPEFVEEHFLEAARIAGLEVERRADGLLRIRRVPQHLRSDRLEAVRKFGKPEPHYNKATFHKEHLASDRHADAVFLSPAHPLYAAVEEVMRKRLSDALGAVAFFADPVATSPYLLHFFRAEIVGDYPTRNALVHAQLVAVKEHASGLELVPPEIIYSLIPLRRTDLKAPEFDLQRVSDFVRLHFQAHKRKSLLEDRKRQERIIREHLDMTFRAQSAALQRRLLDLRARQSRGEEGLEPTIARLEQDMDDLKQRYNEQKRLLDHMAVLRPGRVAHIASLVVVPAEEASLAEPLLQLPRETQESERAAMRIAMDYERQHGRTPYDVSREYGLGFDIRSIGQPDPQTGEFEVRRIEVKGRARGQPVSLTHNEWLKAKQLKNTYWLYVVWDPTGPQPELLLIQNPAEKLAPFAKEVLTATHHAIPADALEKRCDLRYTLTERGEGFDG